MWAACDGVNLVELQGSARNFPGNVTWAIVTPEYKWSFKLCKDHSQFLYYRMCGSIWNFPHDQEFCKVITYHKKVHSVPVEQVSSQDMPWMEVVPH